MNRINETHRCYNCSKPLSADEIHVEHIPARNLFDGFPNEYKQDRITVHACLDCNKSYMVVDEEFRNFIGVINKRPEATSLVEKTARSIERLFSKKARVIYNEEQKPLGVRFDRTQIDAYHVKNFKGVFYYNYKMPLPEGYKIVVHSDETKKSQAGIRLLDYLQNNFKMKVSGHENVFRYIIQPFRPGSNFDGSDIAINANDQIIALLSYTKNHAALVVAERSKNQ